MTKSKKAVDTSKVAVASSEPKARKVRVSRNGKPTNIMIATTMLLQGCTMKDIEKATGDTSYAAVRKLEAQGYVFDKSQRDSEGRIFYHAVLGKKEVKKAA